MRKRAKSFENHYSQARMFWKSMSAVEAEHIVAAFAFELGKVEVPDIRSAVVAQLAQIDHELASQVAAKLGLPEPPDQPLRRGGQVAGALRDSTVSPTRSCRAKLPCWPPTAWTCVGTQRFKELMQERGAVVEVLAPVAGGTLAGGSGGELPVDRAFTTMASVLYDAVVVACGPRSVSTLRAMAMPCTSWSRPTSTSSRSGRTAPGSTYCARRKLRITLPTTPKSSATKPS